MRYKIECGGREWEINKTKVGDTIRKCGDRPLDRYM